MDTYMQMNYKKLDIHKKHHDFSSSGCMLIFIKTLSLPHSIFTKWWKFSHIATYCTSTYIKNYILNLKLTFKVLITWQNHCYRAIDSSYGHWVMVQKVIFYLFALIDHKIQDSLAVLAYYSLPINIIWMTEGYKQAFWNPKPCSICLLQSSNKNYLGNKELI